MIWEVCFLQFSFLFKACIWDVLFVKNATCICPGNKVHDGFGACKCPGNKIDNSNGTDICECPSNQIDDGTGANNCINNATGIPLQN